MKHYNRISNELYHKPWCILPSAHTDLIKGFESYLKGNFKIDTMPNEDCKNEGESSEIEINNGLAIINVIGVIGKGLGMVEQCMGGCDLNRVCDNLKTCLTNENVTNILLYVNSPGGVSTGVQECAELIAEINQTKKIYCYTDGQMCSAAYWLGSQCEAIYCSPTSDVGSVGVYVVIYDCSQVYINEGVKVNAIVNGKFKIMGADFQPLTDEEKLLFQKDVDKIATKFKSAVLQKRTIDIANLDGQIFDGEDSVDLGFCDGLCNDLDEVLKTINS